MAGFQSPISIQHAIEAITKNEYLLPAFQRELVWKSEQIEKLFDSLMKGYPINSMLFWKVKGETKTKFKFYQLLKNYIQTYKTQADMLDTDGVNDFHSILDGQQRLTALYIGLKGSYAYHEYRRKKENTEWSYPTRHLYLNISSMFNQEESDMLYKFSFLNKSDTEEKDIYIDSNSEKWFKVGCVLTLHKKELGVNDFIQENKLDRTAHQIINKLDYIVHNTTPINYYEEDDQNPDKAVNIFVRINSGGTYLSFSDILMSITIATWKKDAKTEIRKLIENVREKDFSINNDYILKAFLYLYHKDVQFQIASFKNHFIEIIEGNWDKIRNSILKLFDLLKTFGLNANTLVSYNATLPILYYIYHRNIYNEIDTRIGYEEERKAMKKWIFNMLVRRAFGGTSDTVLSQARRAYTEDIEIEYINSSIKLFPSEMINKNIKRLTDIGDDFIEELLMTQKDSRYSFSVLALLYPNLDYRNNNFHQDHLHPASKYDELTDSAKENYGWDTYNSILNLQMLDANENESKNNKTLEIWVSEHLKEQDRRGFLEAHLIPDVDLQLENFPEFVEQRKKLLISKLKTILN